jgi:YHS domain-containing protein
MFVDVEGNTKAPVGLSIPQDAVLDSGLQKIVYVETSDDVFEPRPVQLGAAFGDLVEIVRGLEVGDRIVTSGNFLVDSESRIRSAKVVSNNSKNELVSNRDPVCGMPLDTKQTHDRSYSSKYRGETFLFCSEKCQKKFEQDPAKFAGEKVGSVAIPAGGSNRGDAKRGDARRDDD